MKVAIGQINPCIGDLEGNVERCLAAVQTVLSEKPDLILFPELAIPGCHPRDILFDTSFIDAVSKATEDLARQTSTGPPLLVGTLFPSNDRPSNHPGLFNAAALLQGGRVHLAAAKQLLPIHDVFYEPRWFLPGPSLPPITIAGIQVGVLMGQELLDEGRSIHPSETLTRAGEELLVCLSASPFQRQKMNHSLTLARRKGCPIFFVNLCGANDELIYDGGSFALNSEGQVIAQLPAFREDVRLIDLARDPPMQWQDLASEEALYQALVLGVRDFFKKNRLDQAFLGLSGGVDSAVVAVITAEALGPERVTAIAIPSRYSDPRSTTYAEKLAHKLGVNFEVVNLEYLHKAAEETLGDLLKRGTTGENVQPRLRTMILMSYVNHYGGALINTSNKTELSLGYSTLYGDIAGSLCPIADLTKPEVYELAKWINRSQEIIPSGILERQPTAELKPGQVDPFDYPKISPDIEELVRTNRSNFTLRTSEHKRWQMGIVLKVSEKAFGSGRMIPITRK
jgi:NAD+ synthase (glutamine-hydrolysing)